MRRPWWDEPAIAVAVLQSVVALIVAWVHPTLGQAGAVEAAAAAAGALIVVVSVRPFRVAALTGLLTAAGTVLVAFKVGHITVAQVSVFNFAVAAIVAAFVRTQVTPLAHLPVEPPPPHTAA